MPHPLIEMIGKQFGTYKVVADAGYNQKDKKHYWKLKCDNCGAKISLPGTDIRRTKDRDFGSKCSTCMSIKHSAPAGMKRCQGPCNQALLPEEFYICDHHSDKLSSLCKKCAEGEKKLINAMINSAKKRAKDKNLDFDIDIDFIRELNKKQNGKCAYTGVVLNWNRKEKGKSIFGQCPANRASLDRKNSLKGYTKDNVQLVANVINIMKNIFTEHDFLKTCQLVINKAVASGKDISTAHSVLVDSLSTLETCDSTTNAI